MSLQGQGREGGVIGVGGASIVYGLAYSILHGDPGGLTIVAVTASILTMMLTGPAWRSTPMWRLVFMIPPGLLYAIVVYETLPASLPHAAASGALAIAALTARGTGLIGVGGPLLASTGGFIALASGSGPIAPLIPVAYTLLTVPIATGVVLGDWTRTAVPTALGGLAVLAAGVGACLSTCSLGGGILLLDALARLLLVPTGLLQRVPVALYGYHEAVHTLAVWLAIAILCPSL